METLLFSGITKLVERAFEAVAFWLLAMARWLYTKARPQAQLPHSEATAGPRAAPWLPTPEYLELGQQLAEAKARIPEASAAGRLVDQMVIVAELEEQQRRLVRRLSEASMPPMAA
ncbi:hypothetical protein [Azospirillum sp. SYSU D00513]|uniref:hypothetical protein n=1 Tax=Azospirillum sp. SYSU D00513 TaxID=2812561 RepID=UPI001A97C6EA|nr:hypothetical protein [Azospirillum sp. SYSU D00513]